MSDKYEPYLEPLFIPGVLSLVLGLIFASEGIFISPGVSNDIYSGLYLILYILLFLTALAVLIYEVLLIFKVIKPVVFIKSKTRWYMFLRWIIGFVGVMSILYVSWFLTTLVLLSNSPKWTTLD